MGELDSRTSPVEDRIRAIGEFLGEKTGAGKVVIERFEKLAGGAIQENWLLDALISGGAHHGKLEAVLRCDAPSGVAVSHGRAQEFALLEVAFEAGVKVPEPLCLGDASVFGRDFFIMRRAAGISAGHRLVKDTALVGDRIALAEQIGRQMARIHSIVPPDERLGFLPVPRCHPARGELGKYRAFLDGHREPHPALEFGLRWLELNLPDDTGLVLCHRDFRTGNYLVDEKGLTAVLDWEFAGWSNALEDLGWFCARCWRFGRTELEAGGIAPRTALYRGYAAGSGRPIDHDQVRYWEVFATARWALIAIQQGERFVSGEQDSLELALTAHLVPGLELDLLAQIDSFEEQARA